MKRKRDSVNLEYKISSRKGKATEWISKSSKKQTNIRYSTYKGKISANKLSVGISTEILWHRNFS